MVGVPAQTSTRERLLDDLGVLSAVVAVVVLLGAPAGLLWSAVAPRLTVTVTAEGADAPDLLTSKAFIGADVTFLLIALGMGVLCGLLAWRFARRSGPFTVVGLVLGGLLAALVAAEVGVRPNAEETLRALNGEGGFRGQVDLYLGRLDKPDAKRGQNGADLMPRAPWTAVGWPVGASLAFLAMAARRPEELD